MSLRYSDGDMTNRDTYSISSATVLSPDALPRWLRHARPRAGVLSYSRLRILLIALASIILGSLLTSSIGPSIPAAPDLGDAYHGSSPLEVLSDAPAGPLVKATQAGILEHEGSHAPTQDGGSITHVKQPSISGALSDLHHAVKGKIHSWNPYLVQAPQIDRPDDAQNSTLYGSDKFTNNSSVRLGETVTDGSSEEERLGARMRIGKCTILFNGNGFWERAIRTHEQHDREHGYRLHVLRQALMDDVWSKPAYILSLLLRELAKPEGDRLEWLFWVDADTIILNPYIPIEVFLPPLGTEFDDIHLVYSNDWNGLNNGVFPVRVNQWSVQLFSAITSYRHFRPEAPLQFRDQSAMDTLMHEPAFASHIAQAPQRWFNAYQGEHNETLAPFQVRRGDFLVHFAGVPAREERMGYWLERAEQHLDDWEVPLKSTSYPQEVKDFWAEQSGIRSQQREKFASSRLKAKELVEQVKGRLAEYGDHLGEEQRTAIERSRDELNGALEAGQTASDTDKIEQATSRLEATVQPLLSIITEAQRLLLKSAHEAILAAEKNLVDGGFNDGSTSPELDRVSQTVKNLKNLVMTPQEHWNRHDITAATNAVTEARAAFQESVISHAASSTSDMMGTKTSEAPLEASQPAGTAANAEKQQISSTYTSEVTAT